MAVFKRSWRLSIELENKVKTFQEIENADLSLKVDFTAKNSARGYCEGDITLYNLSRNDMLYLANCATYSKGGEVSIKHNKISLECGYNGDLAIVLCGNIKSVTADFASVDNKITMKVDSGLMQNSLKKGSAINFDGNIDLKEVCTKLTALQNLKLCYDENVKPVLLKGFTFMGTPLKLLNNLRESFKEYAFYLTEDGESLRVEKIGGSVKINTQVLSYETGLVGSPTPTAHGISIVSLLNTNLRVGAWVKLKSEKISNYNGDWYIMDVQHKGSSQGNEWITQCDLRREAVVL